MPFDHEKVAAVGKVVYVLWGVGLGLFLIVALIWDLVLVSKRLGARRSASEAQDLPEAQEASEAVLEAPGAPGEDEDGEVDLEFAKELRDQFIRALGRKGDEEAAGRLTERLTDERLDMIIRFQNIRVRAKKQTPDIAELYIATKLFNVLPTEVQRVLVDELDAEFPKEVA